MNTVAKQPMYGWNSFPSKAQWVLDADITKCFDRINHEALLAKLETSPKFRRVVKGWLEAGVMEGGVISPLLANIGLHGLETIISEKFPRRRGISLPKVVRYADDLVILHEEREVIEQCREIAAGWLDGRGLEFNENKTRITHRLKTTGGEAGFEFLGFRIGQSPAGKYNSDRPHRFQQTRKSALCNALCLGEASSPK
jgi:RNA-directed DNA polymerase